MACPLNSRILKIDIILRLSCSTQAPTGLSAPWTCVFPKLLLALCQTIEVRGEQTHGWSRDPAAHTTASWVTAGHVNYWLMMEAVAVKAPSGSQPLGGVGVLAGSQVTATALVCRGGNSKDEGRAPFWPCSELPVPRAW